MILCERCPDEPSCRNCLNELRVGRSAQKVLPPRQVRLTLLADGAEVVAELRAVSRTAVGLYCPGQPLHGRIEVELAADFRIIGSLVRGIRNVPYYVLDIEKVLRRNEVLERLLLDEFHRWHLSGELDPASLLKNMRERNDEWSRIIKQELQKLSILRQVGAIYLYLVEDGRLRPLGTVRVEDPLEQEMRRLAARAADAGTALREQVVAPDGSRVYELYASPLPDRTCGLALIDITEAIAEERRRQKKEWDLYKQVLASVTGDKLVLLTDEELFVLIREGEMLAAIDVRAPEDLSRLRRECRRVLEPLGMADKRLLQYIVALNEAASNTLKHGSGGTVTLYRANEQVCRAVVHDQGGGIDLEELPRATLIQGYSTRNSLGVGFHVMLRCCDRLLLCSSSAGTKLVLECRVQPL
ncbi:ATP-binding protein [Brevibacillus sp. MCWH]|uniref:ATP-binding protein n=1 Tax=Brevibacillus sp. MCWH TaxID=2508871 RepID=UPI000E3A8D89|nr:ATP-binding protein [Brevibacillus sp. MCWH]NNV02632.1 ATP-binding protein [Brevibacillus sp. MCWH]REK64485.1 MAG: ATP-binding protein [Brevibacillus sp.]